MARAKAELRERPKKHHLWVQKLQYMQIMDDVCILIPTNKITSSVDSMCTVDSYQYICKEHQGQKKNYV